MIDIPRLQRSVRLKCCQFPPQNDDAYNPKFYKKSQWEPPLALEAIEQAINNFEKETKILTTARRKTPLHYNLNKNTIQTLRQIRKERKLIIINADKNLGPCIIKLEEYIQRVHLDHLSNTKTYKQLTKEEAEAINQHNFNWICKEIIDSVHITQGKRKTLTTTLIRGRDKHTGKALLNPSLDFPYFYGVPKMHKTPMKTRPVISQINTLQEPASKLADVYLQRVVHLCPAYTKNSWHFLNDIKPLSNLQNYNLIVSDAQAMYTSIPTQHAYQI